MLLCISARSGLVLGPAHRGDETKLFWYQNFFFLISVNFSIIICYGYLDEISKVVIKMCSRYKKTDICIINTYHVNIKIAMIIATTRNNTVTDTTTAAILPPPPSSSPRETEINNYQCVYA